MEYQKTNVNAFAGVNVNKRPEMLPDSQASDMENLRFDKIGYLINRNGVQAKPLSMTGSMTGGDTIEFLWPIGTIGMTEYILKAPWGPGSGVASWPPYDDATINAFYGFEQNPPKRYSDKFMVSFIRIPTKGNPLGSASIYLSDTYNNAQRDANEFPGEPENHYTWRYKGAYVIMPLFGPSDFRDTFAFMPNGFPYIINPPTQMLQGTVNADYDYPSTYITAGARSILRADDKPKKTQIYAPSRWMGVHNTFDFEDNPKDANWIDHYVSMNQYRDSIIISDTTNGDLQLVDEYNEAEYSEERKHRFTLRENSLAPFDVDDVVIDFGIGVDFEDGGNEGVEAPMALYKFYLPRKSFESTIDNYSPIYQGKSETPSRRNVDPPFAENWRPIPYNRIGSFMATELWMDNDYAALSELDLVSNDTYYGSSIAINTKDKFLFTNAEENARYDNLFGKLTLQNPDVKQDDVVATDIYRWEDFKIKYYPATGISNVYGRFLTGADRIWNKTTSNAPKLIKLKKKTGQEQNVPLGVWRYRFVWYLGNGEYSAPSAELVVPDLLFSGLSEEEMQDSGIQYSRPAGINSSDDAYKTNIDVAAVEFLNELPGAEHFKIFKINPLDPMDVILTKYGESFVKIKQRLLYPNHEFGAKYTSTNGTAWPDVDSGAWTAESILAKGQVSTICTLYSNDELLTLNGVFCETAMSVFVDTDESDYADFEQKSYSPGELKLNIPLFSTGYQDFEQEKTYTFNSVFTKYGVLRTAYQNRSVWNTHFMYRSDTPAYQIILAGRNVYGLFTETTNSDAKSINDLVQKGSGVYFNVVPFQTSYFQNDTPVPRHWERNNWDDDALYPFTGAASKARYNYRNMTQVRGIKDQQHRLYNTIVDLPSEVQSRLVLTGHGEINLCGYDDYGTIYPEQKRNGETQMSRQVDRRFWHVRKDLGAIIFTDPNTGEQTDGQFSVPYPWEMDEYGNAPLHTFISYQDDPTLPEDEAYVNGAYTPSWHTVRFNNLKVNIVLPGDRLTIPEQLSMYVPASLLFDAPHIRLIVPADRIPRRARQLMIFRTRASHDNAWQPHEYGFVKAIDITRDSNTGLTSGDQKERIVFLDNVKTSDMDFSYNISDFDGFIEPIKSRFCIPLNERVFYANIRESYRPQTPRSSVRIIADPAKPSQVSHKNLNVGNQTELERLWSYKILQGGLTRNITRRYLYYFIAYNDAARSYSLASFSGLIDRGDLQTGINPTKKPLFYCLPSAYDSTIEHLNVYRLQTDTALAVVPFGITIGNNVDIRVSTNKYTTGVFYVAQGLVEYNGIVYYPNSVIKAFDGSDTGVPGLGDWNANPYISTYLNRFVDYFSQQVAPYQTPPFAGQTNRGPNASYNAPLIYDITAYFDNAGGSNYIEKIGDITPENEGIFYDDDLPALGRLSLLQFFQNEDVMPAGVRWSEPYQPNKIKLGSIAEVRSGDGDQITGLAQLYGNIIVFKERSMHRLAVQGSTIPISRVDEISNNVGCIAPNTIITVDNNLYFLSWSGFYKYDNNVLTKVDGDFAEELQVRLRSNMNGVKNPAIRDASCGWNPTYREIYLNLPVMSTENSEGHYGVDSMEDQDHTQGITLMDNVGERDIRGMVYAINLDTNFVTKYRYMDDALYFTDPSSPADAPSVAFLNAPTQRSPRVSGRLYYTNTLGQLRSGEILPPRTYNYNIKVNNVIQYPLPRDASTSYLQTAFYIESPTKEPLSSFDKYQDDFFMYRQNQLGNWQNALNFRNVRVFWASKSWTNDDKSMLKRVRKVFTYVSSSVQPVVVRGIVHTSPLGARSTSDITWQYSYFFSNPNSPAYGQGATGELMAIPTESSGAATSPSQNRGERHLFQVEGGGAFQMEYFGFYWKPVNPYQR